MHSVDLVQETCESKKLSSAGKCLLERSRVPSRKSTATSKDFFTYNVDINKKKQFQDKEASQAIVRLKVTLSRRLWVDLVVVLF